MNLKEVDTLRVGGEDLEFDFTPPASPSKQSGSGFLMPRSESEYSLGLNRSDSVAENIMELGTMCDAGLTVVMVGRVLFFSTAIVWAGSWLNSKGKSSTS